MMRLTSLMIVLISAPFWAGSPGGGIRRGVDAPAWQAQASLELTTSVARQLYCKSIGKELSTLRLDLRLTYKNIGQQPIILYKGSNIAFRQMISASVQNAATNRYLSDISFMVDMTNLPTISGGANPDKNFVVIPSGETFGTTALRGAIVFLRRNGDDKDAGGIDAGEYVLQVEVPTFPYPGSLESELRTRWKASGDLWGENVISRPMTFEVARDPKFVACER